MTNYADLVASDGSGEPIRAAVQADRSIGSSTLTVNLTTNWPTGTFIATTGTLLSDGTLNPTTAQVFYGTASGATITITSFAAGYSDLGNSIGDVVVIKPTTEWANLASQGIQSTTQFPAQFANFVEPAGGVWSTSSGLVGAMTAGNVWYNGVRSAMPLITSKTFTASKDTYVDFNPSSSAFTYVAETNGSAEPAVTASNVRVAKVVTEASAISSIAQGQYQTPVSNPFSTIFSRQVQSYTNTGSGGGTGYYINLGGIKLCWGVTGVVSGAPNYNISLPPSFFTTIQFSSQNTINSASANAVVSCTTTTFTVYTSGSITGSIQWFVIGT